MKYKFTDSYNETYDIHINTGSSNISHIRIHRINKDGHSWNEIYFNSIKNNEINWADNIGLDPETIYPDVRKYCERIIKLYHFS